jgi:methylaspartate ammonia-lyase
MLGFLRAMITRQQATDMMILQKGGGFYPHADIRSVDEVGVSATINGKVRFIPWTSINEIAES